ncbi:SGNH/GDSL hydrolase family protein [Achromobacter sp. GG226]|uniref:SGNH/GDSL hydrolase family protein n=1 Tax=Verticiella alkaliphila TaxID=2779529 RepID=UPI001C0E623F|nr:SGNH/GDSL hydrolase family protein [Verticiella sp. GG226]MBU4609710.1 SGNH/GDSL hydrolase family protein [Verticiella sp. GG226]
MHRIIKLKEWGVNVDEQRVPTPEYLAHTDGSIGAGPYRLRTDSDGFIHDGRDKPNENTPSIIFLGSSITECMFLPEGHRLSDCVQAELNAMGTPFSVRNGGVSGTTLLHAFLSLLAKVVPLKPAAVIIMTGILDIECAEDKRGFWTDQLFASPLRTTPETPPTSRVTVPIDFSDRTRLLRAIDQVGLQFGITIIHTTFAHRGIDQFSSRNLSYFQESARKRSLVNENTRQHCYETDAKLIDLEAEFSNQCEIFYDDFHLNELGAQTMGRAIAKEIKKILAETCS